MRPPPVPITDELGYRVYAYRSKRDGYIENKGGSDLWDIDHDGWGAQFAWDALDNLDIWLSFRNTETDDIRTGIFPGSYLITPYNTELSNVSFLMKNEGYQWSKENPAVKDPYKVDLNDPLQTRAYDSQNYTTHVTWELSNFSLKYIGNYNESKYRALDGDFGYTSRSDIRTVESARDKYERYSHELQMMSATDDPPAMARRPVLFPFREGPALRIPQPVSRIYGQRQAA